MFTPSTSQKANDDTTASSRLTDISGVGISNFGAGVYRCMDGNYAWAPAGFDGWGILHVQRYGNADWGDWLLVGTTGMWFGIPDWNAGTIAWIPIATATPPQEFDLPLAEGWEIKNSAKYCKDQFGVVSLTFRIGKTTPPTTQGTIGILPVGFRPSHPVHAAAISYPGLASALLVIGTDGSILIFFNGQEASQEGSFCGIATFATPPDA